MIEYIVLFLILIFIFYSYYKDKHAVFIIVLANLIIFFIELFYLYNNIDIYSILGFNTKNILSIQLITGIFTHYDYIHILSNMVVLLFVGYPFEVKIGSRKFIIIYLITGIVSEIIYALINFNLNIILLGASGAIFGIMGAFLRLYPDEEIAMFLGFIFMPKIKVKYAVFFAALIEFLAMALSYEPYVAHLVHISALVIGILIAPLFLKSNVKRISYDDLEPFATNEELKNLLNRIKNENIEIIRNVLIEDFLRKSCNNFEKKNGYIKCNGKRFRL